MNIDEMKEEEKDAAESGAGVSEEKNSNEPQVATPADAQGSLNMDAEEKTSDGKETEKAAEPVNEPLKPGAQLAAFRVAAGVDQEQVAASLKMTVRQVRELEADNYEALHGVAISRGFIRAYAKMLQVDPEPLVAMFKSEEPASKQLDQIPRQNTSERFMQSSQSFGKKRSFGKTGWLILVVIVLALAYGAHSMKWFSGGFSFKKKTEPVANVKKPEASKSVSTVIDTPKVAVSESEKAAASSENAFGKDEKAGQADDAKKEGDTAAAEAASPDADKQNADKAESSSPQQDKQEKAAEPQPEKAAEAAPAVPQNLLVVSFNGPSRVEVLKANGATLREFDGKAGDVQKLEINEPVTVVAKKAANVQVQFREQPLVLKTARRSAEARVELK